MSTQTSERTAPKHAGANRNFDSEVREYYRILLRRLDWPSGSSSRLLRTLGVTSCCSKEGVSTVAAHLAATAASWSEYQVLLVDANPFRPSVHQIFGVDLTPGLADFLSDDSQLTRALQVARVADAFALDDEHLANSLQCSPVENLSIFAAGKPLGNPAWVYDSADICGVVEILENRFDLVVFDMPAVGAAGSMTRLAGLLDGVLLVVEADRVSSSVARQTSNVLSKSNVHLLGAVLNKRRGRSPTWV